MKKYDFDAEINRKNTHCAKWDYQGGDYIPLWIADMDFKAPQKIIDAIKDRVDHGIFGYTSHDWELKDVVVDYYKKNYDKLF